VRIEQLEYVAAVARLGSFRRAAEELHISQPALSGSVRSLERELGVDLLERGRHGARMSSSGRELLPHLRGVLDAVDQLRLAAGEQHRSVRLVRVGTVNAASGPLLAPAIRQFRDRHPATQVEVIAAQRPEIQRGVLEGSLDLGVTAEDLDQLVSGERLLDLAVEHAGVPPLGHELLLGTLRDHLGDEHRHRHGHQRDQRQQR